MKNNYCPSPDLTGKISTGLEKIFFKQHLDIIHCAKSHLLERLPELIAQTNFSDMQPPVMKVTNAITKQINMLDRIYRLLDESPATNYCEDTVSFLECGFSAIYKNHDNRKVCDLSIAFYLSVIENVEFTSFRILKLAANYFPDKQIKRMLIASSKNSASDCISLKQLQVKHNS